MSSDYFQAKFAELQEYSPEQDRGRVFNYFIGLLFQQLPSTEVAVSEDVATGEIDVFVSCLDSPAWLTRLVGSGTVIENKWQKDPVENSDIETFYKKAERVAVKCNICYVVSMSGFTSGDKMSAEQVILEKSDPALVGIEKEDVHRMIDDGTPAGFLRDRQLM